MGEQAGAPAGARQNVRSETSQGAVARPGGATQNSGGAIANNEDEAGPEEPVRPGARGGLIRDDANEGMTE